MASAGAVLVPVAPKAQFEARFSARATVLPRLASVDLLRGAAMVVMTLDHTRSYFTNLQFPPENLGHTSGTLFFTRFLTHFCAPIFFALAGTAIYLSRARGKSVAEVSGYLWTRGLWLILLDISLITYAWSFTVTYLHAGVIWTLAWSMIAMALIVRLPLPWVAILGAAIVGGHHVLDVVNPTAIGNWPWLWYLLYRPGQFWIVSVPMLVTFPLIPWAGVMMLGYAFGPVLLRSDRRKIILAMGAILTIAFFVLRSFHLYGNGTAELQPVFRDSAGPWKIEPTLTLTIVSFFNTLKFPPSLQFLLMTLGPSLLVLAWLDGIKVERRLAKVLLVFGRVPLFFYILHIYLIHTAAVWVALALHQPAAWLLYGGFMLNPVPASYGHGLLFIYMAWAIFVVLLYFPCRWFMRYKQQHREQWWLSYL
jgi:uncharacterized membrane protein